MPGIFVQASAEPNDCVKPNEQNRVYSNFAMASNRTFKNLVGLCRAQPNFRASECNRACSYCRAQPKISKQKSQRRGTTPKDRFPVTHSDTKILLLFHQSQTNVIAFFVSAQSVILPFAIFTLLLFRKF